MSAESGAIPQRVHRKIELERRRLKQASAVLKCLNIAFIEDAEIDFGDIAIVAYTIIDSVIDELDIVTLERVRAHGSDPHVDGAKFSAKMGEQRGGQWLKLHCESVIY